jgi:hypothetical protein
MGKKRAILLVALIAVLGGGAAAYFMGGTDSGGGESVRTVNAAAGGASATSTDSLVAEITATIYQIDRLQLDSSIFNSAAFRVLQDRTQTIPPEIPGRENPFAPLYSEGRMPATSSPRTTRPAGQGGLLGGLETPTVGRPGSATGTAPALPVR